MSMRLVRLTIPLLLLAGCAHFPHSIQEVSEERDLVCFYEQTESQKLVKVCGGMYGEYQIRVRW